MINLRKPVKLKHPQPGEEGMLFKVVNYNEETQRCYIELISERFAIAPQELVSINDIENIEDPMMKTYREEWAYLLKKYGRTRAEHLQKNFEEYVRSRTIGNYSFDSVKHQFKTYCNV